METFSALLALRAGNSPVPGEFHAQRPVTQSFDVFFDLRLNKRLRKQSRGWWFDMPPRSLDVIVMFSFSPVLPSGICHYVQFPQQVHVDYTHVHIGLRCTRWHRDYFSLLSWNACPVARKQTCRLLLLAVYFIDLYSHAGLKKSMVHYHNSNFGEDVSMANFV